MIADIYKRMAKFKIKFSELLIIIGIFLYSYAIWTNQI